MCLSWIWKRSTLRDGAVWGRGILQFEAMWCAVYHFVFQWIAQESRMKTLGGFEVALVWKSKVTMIKSLSVLSYRPRPFIFPGLSGFTQCFPCFRVTSQVLNHNVFCLTHTTHFRQLHVLGLLRNLNWCFICKRQFLRTWSGEHKWLGGKAHTLILPSIIFVIPLNQKLKRGQTRILTLHPWSDE